MNKETYSAIINDQISIPTRLITNYKQLNLTELDLAVILQIHQSILSGVHFPTPKHIASRLTISETECTHVLKKLMQTNLLRIKNVESNDHKLTESYSLELLWDRLYSKSVEKVEHDGSIYILFEQEFGRPLSPFEIETISIWLDEDLMKPSLIKAALRESVLMGKLNFKYIDRILREWKRKGIKTVEAAREASRPFHKNQEKKVYQTDKAQSKTDKSIYYNWLEGE